MANYFLLNPPADARYCVIHQRPDDMPKAPRPTRGKSMDGLYSEPLDFAMSSQARGMQVADVIKNTVGYLMVSERMKVLLEANAKNVQVEYLPFRLRNHKKRVAADPCYIVNVIGIVNCGDKAASEGMDTPVHPGELMLPRRLGLDPKRVPDEANIFRIDIFPAGIWVRDDLRAVIEREKMTARFVASGEEI